MKRAFVALALLAAFDFGVATAQGRGGRGGRAGGPPEPPRTAEEITRLR